MADRIMRCDKTMNDSNEVVQYDFCYVVESDNRTNQFCVTIFGTEMIDRSDEDEARAKANAKAAILKATWLNKPITVTEDVSSVIGNVTL